MTPTPVARGWNWGFDSDSEGWRSVRDVGPLSVEDGLLKGTTTGQKPMVVVDVSKLSKALMDPNEQIYSVEIRAAVGVSGRFGVEVSVRGDDPDEFKPVGVTSVEHVEEMITYIFLAEEVATGFKGTLRRVKFVGIVPSDAADCDFQIDSIRFITESEYMATAPQGRARVDLEAVWCDAVVTRVPEPIEARVRIPADARLTLLLGTPQRQPVTFTVTAQQGRNQTELVRREVSPQMAEKGRTKVNRWEFAEADLTGLAGKEVDLRFETSCKTPGVLAYWGNVTIESAPAKPKPNVLVYLIDTLRRDRLSLYGYSRETSPVIDAFAAQGAVFEDAICQSTWTKISVTTLFSSLYPTEHGVLQWGNKLADGVTTLTERMKDAGYATFGTTANPFVGNDSNLQQGFEVFYESSGVNREFGEEKQRGGKEERSTARPVNDVLELWMPRMGHRPFFVYAHVTDPHSPYNPDFEFARLWRKDPKADRERQNEWNKKLKPMIPEGFRRASCLPQGQHLDALGIPRDTYFSFYSDMYDAEVRQSDVEFNRVLKLLDKLGFSKNTLIVLVADHGEQFLEHEGAGHGDSVYAETVRVPLIMRLPGVIPSGTRVSSVTGLVDVTPTILDLLDIPSLSGVSGRSLASQLRGAEARTMGSNIAEAHATDDYEFAIYSEQHPPPNPKPGDIFSHLQFGLTTSKWRAIETLLPVGNEPEFALFDRASDPYDQRNVADAHAEVAEQLREMINTWHREVESRAAKTSHTDEAMPPAELQRLRDLGYVK